MRGALVLLLVSLVVSVSFPVASGAQPCGAWVLEDASPAGLAKLDPSGDEATVQITLFFSVLGPLCYSGNTLVIDGQEVDPMDSQFVGDEHGGQIWFAAGALVAMGPHAFAFAARDADGNVQGVAGSTFLAAPDVVPVDPIEISHAACGPWALTYMQPLGTAQADYAGGYVNIVLDFTVRGKVCYQDNTIRILKPLPNTGSLSQGSTFYDYVTDVTILHFQGGVELAPGPHAFAFTAIDEDGIIRGVAADAFVVE